MHEMDRRSFLLRFGGMGGSLLVPSGVNYAPHERVLNPALRAKETLARAVPIGAFWLALAQEPDYYQQWGYQEEIVFMAASTSIEGLAAFLNEHQDEYEQFMRLANTPDLFGNLKPGLSVAQQKDAVAMYYPIYKAAEVQYGIPAVMLLVAHGSETTWSTAPNPHDYQYRGAMQMDPGYWPDEYRAAAAKGWDFLRYWPQHWHPGKDFSLYDYQEILGAARKMGEDVKKLMANGLSYEQAVKQAQYSYCASPCPETKVYHFERIKHILEGLDDQQQWYGVVS